MKKKKKWLRLRKEGTILMNIVAIQKAFYYYSSLCKGSDISLEKDENLNKI